MKNMLAVVTMFTCALALCFVPAWADVGNALIEAANEGDVKLVEALIAKGANVNAKDKDGEGALMKSAWRGHVEVSKILVEKGADVNAKDGNGSIALMAAVNQGHAEVTKILIEKGADVNTKDNSGETPLLLAASQGHIEVSNLLIEKGAHINAKDNVSGTALMRAAWRGHTEISELLIEKGADLNAEDWNGWTALTVAAERGNSGIAKLLLNKGAHEDAFDWRNWRIISARVAAGDFGVMRILVKSSITLILGGFCVLSALFFVVYTDLKRDDEFRRHMLRRALWLAVAILILLDTLAVVSLLGIRSPRVVSEIKSSNPETGYCYISPVGIAKRCWVFVVESDYDVAGSNLELLENGVPLPFPHSQHDDIRNLGGGRYSHWGDNLFFSALDNSNPKTNGKKYEAVCYLQYKGQYFITQNLALLGVLALLVALGGARERPLCARLFWIIFFSILFAGVAVRLGYTLGNSFPFLCPDSDSYIDPAIRHPLTPFGGQRTIVYPLLISLSFSLFGHPIGILIMQNFLWLFSTGLLTWAIKKKLGMRVLSLAMLFYLCFFVKNLQFEYFALSEHLARTLYVIFVALMILSWKRVTRTTNLLFAVAVILNIFVKPSAVILAPAYLVYLAANARLCMELKPYLKRAAEFVAVFAVVTLAYCGMFYERYGMFNISAAAWNDLFSHTGHLVNLESHKYEDIKVELRKFMPQYIERFKKTGISENNWLIYGAQVGWTEETVGDQSPAKVISTYINKQPGDNNAKMALYQQTYMGLALEGIISHPMEYALYVIKSMHYLASSGYSFAYGSNLYGSVGKDENDLKESLAYFEKKFDEYHLAKPQIITELRATAPRWYLRLGSLLRLIAVLIDDVTYTLAYLAPLLFAVLAWKSKRDAYLREHLILISLITLVIALYMLFMGMFNVSDPSRFFGIIQDLFVISVYYTFFLGAGFFFDMAKRKSQFNEEAHHQARGYAW